MEKKKNSKIKKIAITILLLVFAISIFLNFKSFKKKDQTVLMSETLDEQIMQISEMSTVKYNYTDVISYENSRQLSGVNIPFTNKKFIVKYSGYLKAGLDLTDAKLDIEDEDKIKVRLPRAVILDNVIIEEEVAFFDEKNGVFNPLKYSDLYDVLIEEKEKKSEEAIKSGLLEEAENNLDQLLRLYLKDLGFEKIDIEFRDL